MKRVYTIALFAAVFAVAIGSITLYGISATPLMVTAIPQTTEPVGMYGHIDFVVKNNEGLITTYVQTDNVVTNTGNDCVARLAFDNTQDPGLCASVGEFKFIAIGNFTVAGAGTTNSTYLNLDNTDTAPNPLTCASSTIDGEMARRQTIPIFTGSTGDSTTGGSGTIVKLDTGEVGSAAFTFDASNATTVFQSGLFDTDEAAADDVCTTITDGGRLFSVQKLSGDNGITVSDGDSLSIKWTITVG